MDMSQYLQIFIEESKDNLQSLNEHLLKLEATPDDVQILNEIFRVAHTLKGMSGTMGFTNMQNLTHHAENVLSEIRSGKIKVNPNMIDILFRCLDALENAVEEIVQTSSEGNDDYKELINQLEQVVSGEVTTPKETIKNNELKTSKNQMVLPEEVISIRDAAIQSDMNVFEIEITLNKQCVLKAARAFVMFSELGRMGDIVYSLPSVQEIEDEQFDQTFSLVFITEYDQDSVEKTVMSVAEVERVDIKMQVMDENTQTTQKDEITPELVVDKIKEEKVEVQKTETQNQKQQVSTKSVRVNIDRLDTLMNLVSELIIVKTQLEGLGDQDDHMTNNYNDSIEYLERVTSSLHDAVMKVRMVPIESVFNRFPRMIRDIARKLEKDIELVISGEETELDRTVIDEIGDPLIHLLRNAADHGLETTEERIKLGKNAKGTIKLQAYQDGNSVVIEVGDDGKGIDANKIRSKALEKGSITSEISAGMSDQEVIELLFKPSFSTAEQVTDLSGRGVGLDVVKSKITSLGGNVEIKTQLGLGSTFIVRLPLTLAIIQALMVNIGVEKYAIPLSNIKNIENIQKADIKLVQKQEVVVLRNQVIPIIRLANILDIEVEEQESMMMVVAQKGEKQVGFIVDSLIGQQEIVIKPLGKYLNQISMIAGATILGNGEVALILDINTLV